MKLRITFAPLPHASQAVAVELEGEKLQFVPSPGWLIIESDGHFVVAYPADVVRSVADVGAFESVVVKPSENPNRRQQAR